MEKGLKKVVSAPHLQLLLHYTLRNINTYRIKILICQICSQKSLLLLQIPGYSNKLALDTTLPKVAKSIIKARSDLVETIENLGRDEVAGGDTVTAAMTAAICCVWIKKRTTWLASTLFEQTSATCTGAMHPSEAAALSDPVPDELRPNGSSGQKWCRTGAGENPTSNFPDSELPKLLFLHLKVSLFDILLIEFIKQSAVIHHLFSHRSTSVDVSPVSDT